MAKNNKASKIIIPENNHFGEDLKLAFKADGIEFYGIARKYLYFYELDSTDLVINFYGEPLYNNNLVSCSRGFEECFPTSKHKEICLRIPDGGFLWPQQYNLSFWQDIFNKAKEQKIKRIIMCCLAGIGRTGTGLAAMHMLHRYEHLTNHKQSIEAIREHYYKKAIETKFQEMYLEKIFTAGLNRL